MPSGPCALCGDTNYALSMGGPMVCPACDCGNVHDRSLATKRMLGLKPAPQWNERRLGLHPIHVGLNPRPCTSCSCTGLYVDYAGPGVFGGVGVPCATCGGRGWVA